MIDVKIRLRCSAVGCSEQKEMFVWSSLIALGLDDVEWQHEFDSNAPGWTVDDGEHWCPRCSERS